MLEKFIENYQKNPGEIMSQASLMTWTVNNFRIM